MQSTQSSQIASAQSFAPPRASEYDAKAGKAFLSIVVPIYNDGGQAAAFCAELQSVLSEYFKTETLAGKIELLFIDDGSPNNCGPELCKLTSVYPFVRVIQLSRNFGQHVAQSCGYTYASGEYVATVNVDMQDPLYELPRLLDRIQQNDLDYVRGVRKERQDPLLSKITSRIFLKVFRLLAGIQIPKMPSSLRVMSRRYVDAFNLYTEKVRFAIGLEYWLGFKCDFVEIDHIERKIGKSSYNFKKRLSMALDAIVSFSDVPLKIGIYGGVFLASTGLILGLWYLIEKLLIPGVLPGFTSIVVILLVSQGSVLMMLGIMGLYIGRILKEVQNRPLFIVRETHNFPE